MSWDGTYCTHKSTRCDCGNPKPRQAPLTSVLRLKTTVNGQRGVRDFKIKPEGTLRHVCIMDGYRLYDRGGELCIAVDMAERGESLARNRRQWNQYPISGCDVFHIEARDLQGICDELRKRKVPFILSAQFDSRRYQAFELESRGLVPAGSSARVRLGK